jgi:hypothetical protein
MAWSPVDNLVLNIKGNRRISYGERLKSSVHEMSRVIDEMFRRHGVEDAWGPIGGGVV